MKRFLLKASLVLAFLYNIQLLQAQNFYNNNVIQDIEISFSQSNWDYMMDTAKNGEEEYIMADWVKVNGVQFDSVGIKYKGNSSYDSTIIKNPMHISLNEFKNQNYQGYQDIKLSNGYGDPSLIREVLAYDILKKYMHCPLSNFAKVTINGNYIGLYSSNQSIDKKFLGDHFYSNYNTFVKCNPTGAPTPALKSNLSYLGIDSANYTPFYELKSKYGWNEFIDLCNQVSSNSTSLANTIDMDRTIWMLAYNNLFVNLDSYNGVYAQNHYTYKDNTGHFNPIIWDLNMCFGSFPYAGTGTIGVGQKTLTELKEYSPFAHATDVAWPLINDVLSNATNKRKYVAHLKTMLNENIVNGDYQTKATQFRTLIDNEVANDTHKLFTYAQFQNGLTSDVTFGSFIVPGINNLMEARKVYLQSLPELSATAPTITNYVSNPINPSFNGSFSISALVQNATSVMLGYRFDKTQKFTQVALFDDGLHGDGSANDNVYGTNLTMLQGSMQYYMYAENNDAGIFSPQRAEHEFYEVFALQSQPTAGQLVINEFLADNISKELDEYGASEDWIELYNTSNNILNLSACYLSDDVNQLNKWPFPNGTSINPNAYLTIWADDDSIQQILHTNFNLNKDSGHIYVSLPTQVILDSISYTTQTSNVSFGRYPNGSGPFMAMNRTFGTINNNDPLQVKNITSGSHFQLFPNPSNAYCNLLFEGEKMISVFTITGVNVLNTNVKNKLTIDTSNWQDGLYIVKCGEEYAKFIVGK